MNFIEAKEIEILGMIPYEYIHYRSSDGREFLRLNHESGFLSYSENVELTAKEITALKIGGVEFINQLRSSFCHSKKKFLFHSGKRSITNFDQWPSVESALRNWHGR